MIVKYVIDTNVIRGLSARSNDVDAQKHQKQCQYFWKKIKEDSNAILLIPEEVKVELDVQLLAEIPPKPNERQRILDAVNDCQIVHLYLFLSEADEEVLYDTGTGEYLSISTELHEAVLSDEEFSTRLEDFFEAWNQLD